MEHALIRTDSPKHSSCYQAFSLRCQLPSLVPFFPISALQTCSMGTSLRAGDLISTRRACANGHGCISKHFQRYRLFSPSEALLLHHPLCRCVRSRGLTLFGVSSLGLHQMDHVLRPHHARNLVRLICAALDGGCGHLGTWWIHLFRAPPH